MNYGSDLRPTSLISIHFDVNVSSQIPRITLENLTPNVIMESYLDTLNRPRHIECITP